MRIEPEKMWSIASEAGAIASIIVEPACLMDVISELPDVEMFFEDKHKVLYDTLLDLFLAKTPIDAITLRNQLEITGQLVKAGGVEYISKIMQSVPSSANALYYAKRVKEKYQYRNMLQAVAKIQSIANEDGTVSEQVESIQKVALELQGWDGTQKLYTMRDGLQAIKNLRTGKKLIKTGFKDIDDLIGGFTDGEYNIVAARPSMGKTAICLNMAINMAKRGDLVLFFTLEMSEESLIDRTINSIARISLSAAKKGWLSEDKWRDLESVAEQVKDLPVILTSMGSTIEQITTVIRKIRATQDLKCVFIDYIQLMRTTRKFNNREQQIAEISRGLRRLAVTEEIPVIVLSQLNRDVDNRTGHRPVLSDLRESGAIEQDADIVLFLKRDDYYRARESKGGAVEFDGCADLIVAKNKNGETGDIQLVFVREFCSFENKSNLGEFVYGK